MFLHMSVILSTIGGVCSWGWSGLRGGWVSGLRGGFLI